VLFAKSRAHKQYEVDKQSV